MYLVTPNTSILCFLLFFIGVTKFATSSVLFVHNARIYTVDDENPWAQALSIDQDLGIILAVGTTAAVNATLINHDDNVTLLDLQGRLVLPGFHDAHLHVVEAGLNANLCLLDEDAPLSELDYYFYPDAEYCPTGGPFGDQGWIVGAGLDIGILLEKLERTDNPNEYPVAYMDRTFPDKPAFILDAYGHGALANSLALEAVGFDQLESDPPGGILVRKGSVLTGIVLENAQQPLRDAAFPTTIANQQTAYESLLDALPRLASNGITTVSDAGGFWRQAQTDSWERAEKEGLLTVRAFNALYVYPDQELIDQLPTLQNALDRTRNNRLARFTQAKIYVDGILSLGTSALYMPYEDNTLMAAGPFGFEYFGDMLNSVVAELASLGFQLHFHTTGDRGAGLALNAIAALSTNASLPHRLTHCYLVDPSDRSRFSALDVVADFQMAPSSLDPQYESFLVRSIGSDRVEQLLPIKELLDSGAAVVLSSDWDADELSPLSKIQTVLERGARGIESLEEVILLMTRNPAALLGSNAGVIKAGKDADIVVLSTDIFTVPIDQIAKSKVLMTIFGGEFVYDPYGLSGNVIGAPSAATRFMPLSHSFGLAFIFLIAISASGGKI